MKTSVTRFLRGLLCCPDCRAALEVFNISEDGDGSIKCLSCAREFVVKDHIPELLPDILSDSKKNPKMSENEQGLNHKIAEINIKDTGIDNSFFLSGLTMPFQRFQPHDVLERIARFAASAPLLDTKINQVIVDVGVGYAWTTEWLWKMGFMAVGVDICRDYLEYAHTRLGDNGPPLIVADIENLPFRDEIAASVFCFDSFHHVPDREKSIRRFYDVLQPGGKVVFVEPGADHEHKPETINVMNRFGILEKGFGRRELKRYCKNTQFSKIRKHQSDAHNYDMFVITKPGKKVFDSRSFNHLDAKFMIHEIETEVTCGQNISIRFSIRNIGDTVWLCEALEDLGTVRVGVRLFTADERLINADFARVDLPHDLDLGREVELIAELPEINEEGHFILELDMVSEGIVWFQDYFYKPERVKITVNKTADKSQAFCVEKIDA